MNDEQRPPEDLDTTQSDPGDPKDGTDDSTRTGGRVDSDATRQCGKSPDDSLADKAIGDFDLLRELGRGGMGIVYEARQISLNRRVALKVLPPGLGLTEAAVRRFEREARAAAKLHHTNIVPVHAIGEEEGCHYYAMELVEGQPLSEVLRDLAGDGSNPLMDETVTKLSGDEQAESMPDKSTSQPASGIASLSDSSSGSRKWFDAVAKLISEVADALEYAHGRGVIHRDIKPANLMLSRDSKLCVTDFGLARVAQEPGMTVSGSLMGTPAYMSPEQIAVGRVKLDHRTDIYSLGSVLYELLTHRRPFPGDSREEVLSGILSKEPRPPRRFNPRIPIDLETICQKAMEKDPDRRYQTAGLLAQDLRQYLQRGLIAARRAGPLKRAAKWVRRHPVVSVVAAAAVVLAIVSGVALQQGFGRTEANARRLVADAELHLREGTYREGLAKVDEALALIPDSLDAKKTKARLLLELQHDRELANLAKEILDAHPDDWEAHAWLASAGRYGGLADIPAQEHVEAVERLAPDTAEAWRLKGLMSHSKLKAVKCFDRALELDPAHYWALIGRAEAYIELKKFPEAVADAERAIVARPRSPRGRCLLAKIHADGFHDDERALAEYAKAIAIDPEDPITFGERSSVYDNLESYVKYLDDATRALELGQASPSSHLSVALARRAEALTYLGQYEEALSDAHRAIDIEPHRIDGHEALLTALQFLGRLDETMKAMEDIREYALTWADSRMAAYAYGVISAQYSFLEENDKAVTAANRAIELDPEQSHLWLALRGFAQQSAKSQEALEADCDLMARLALREPEPLRLRAFLLWYVCRRVEAALAGYTQALEIAPGWADAYSERGEILRSNRQYREALADHNKAVALAPKWATGFEQRASVYGDLEQWPQVLNDLEQYFALGGGSPDVRGSQAYALAQLGRENEALAVLDSVIRETPQSLDGYWYKADILFNLGRLDEALTTNDSALELEPTNGWALLYRARYLAYKPGSCARAEDDLNKVRELYLAFGRLSAAWMSNEALIRVSPLGVVCPELAQPAQSLELAREAVRYFPKVPHFQCNLGAALYANKQYKDACAVLLEALDLKAKPDPTVLFFLAMTESRLGRQADARRTYDRAVARMNETWPKSPDLVMLKAEAAKLLE